MTASRVATDAESANTRSGMIPCVTYSHTSANRDPGSDRKSRLPITQRRLVDISYFVRAVQLKWRPELVMSGQKIILMKMEHLKFIDSISFLPFPLRKLSTALGLTASKGWYTH